jgi:hypothetical protein
LTKGVPQGIRDIPKILTGRRTDAEVAAGERPRQSTILDIPGRVHGTIKAPFKEAERARSETKRAAFGQSPEQIALAAHLDAKRAIFMQDNVLSDAWSSVMRTLGQSKKFPTAGYTLEKIGRFLLPIVKVPTNVAFESATYLGGSLSGTGKLIAVMSRGLKHIKPEEADMILRHYKKGAVGAGLFLTGFFNAQQFGGFYQKHEKRDPNDLQWGEAKLFGHRIPRWLQHAPAFIVLQAGATARRAIDDKHRKQSAPAASTLAVARGITHEIPFMNELGVIDESLVDGYEGTKARGRLVTGAVVPQGVQDVARMTDQQERRATSATLSA